MPSTRNSSRTYLRVELSAGPAFRGTRARLGHPGKRLFLSLFYSRLENRKRTIGGARAGIRGYETGSGIAPAAYGNLALETSTKHWRGQQVSRANNSFSDGRVWGGADGRQVSPHFSRYFGRWSPCPADTAAISFRYSAFPRARVEKFSVKILSTLRILFSGDFEDELTALVTTVLISNLTLI